MFTSGTTGMPKGAVFTNRQLQAIVEVDTGGTWGSGGKSVASTSLAHVGFMTKLPWYLMSGGARTCSIAGTPKPTCASSPSTA